MRLDTTNTVVLKLQMQILQMFRQISDTSSYFASSKFTSGSMQVLHFRVRLAWSCHESMANVQFSYKSHNIHKWHAWCRRSSLEPCRTTLENMAKRLTCFHSPRRPKMYRIDCIDIMQSDSQPNWPCYHRSSTSLFIKCFQQQVMDNVTNPKKETLIRTTVFRTCSRYIQCTYMCTVYIIFYTDPRRRVLRCRCLCFGSSVLVQVNG